MKHIGIHFVHDERHSLEVGDIPTTRDNLFRLLRTKKGINLQDYYISDGEGEGITDALLEKYKYENRNLLLYVSFIGNTKILTKNNIDD